MYHFPKYAEYERLMKTVDQKTVFENKVLLCFQKQEKYDMIIVLLIFSFTYSKFN